MGNEKFTLNTQHMDKFYKMIETDFQKPKTTKERRQPRTYNPNTEEGNKEKEQYSPGLDVNDFADDFAALVGVDGE